jgi:hypothetical protein
MKIVRRIPKNSPIYTSFDYSSLELEKPSRNENLKEERYDEGQRWLCTLKKISFNNFTSRPHPMLY